MFRTNAERLDELFKIAERRHGRVTRALDELKRSDPDDIDMIHALNLAKNQYVSDMTYYAIVER